MLKKSLALVMALAMVAGVLAGCGGTKFNDALEELRTQIETVTIEGYETPNLNGETLVVYMPENTDFEAANCYAVQAISKTLNVDLVVKELDSFDAQYNPMLVEGNIPSLTNGDTWTNSWRQLGEEGAMVNVLDPDVIKAMPHVKWYLEETEVGKQFVKDHANATGELYCVPYIESGTAACYGYLYRADIFEANDMEFPTTEDEFYNTLRKLKGLYPTSYPFVIRGMSGQMASFSSFAYTWGIGHQMFGDKNSVFTLQNGNYIFAPTTDTYKEVAEYLKMLLDNGLLHPSCFTMDTSGWIEAFAASKSFIGFDKMDRLPSLNLACKQVSPEYKVLGTTAIPFGENGRVETQYVGGAVRYYMIGNNDQLLTTLKYVDWLFSPEGIEITNWGIEGESFYVDEDGNKQINSEFVNKQGSFNATGLVMPGLAGYKDFNAYLSACDEATHESIAKCLKNATADQQILLDYDKQDQPLIDTYALSCSEYAMSQIAKFIAGQRNFSEWDTYINELNTKYHLQELQEAHERAYQKALKR